MNLSQQAKNVASAGRYGDSMLMHVNPAEVKGLSQVMPLTVNPETGQPEAFLPFLAPILGSMLGPSLFASLGMTLSSTVASALGAGLAQTAVTGDLKEGLKTGLTAGLVGGALKGIKGLGGATDVATGATEAATTGATPTIDTELFSTSPQTALESAGISTAPIMGPPAPTQTNLFGDLMSGGPGQRAIESAKAAGATGIDAPLSGLYNFASSPTGLVGAIGLGSASMAEQQKVFEEEMARRAEEEEEERKRIARMNPEMIPVPFQRGGGTDLQDYLSGNVGPAGSNLGSFGSAGYVRERTPTEIDPYFMAGFQPEYTYFRDLNPSATTLTDGTAVTSGTGVGPTMGQTDAMPAQQYGIFDPTSTIGYQSFYGEGARNIIPQVIDPYAPVSFEQREPLAPPPVETTPIVPPDTPPDTPPITPPVIPPDIPIDIDFPSIKASPTVEIPTISTDEYVSPSFDIGVADIGFPADFGFDPNVGQPTQQLEQLSDLQERIKSLEQMEMPSYTPFDPTALQEQIIQLEKRDIPMFDPTGLQTRLSALENRLAPSFTPFDPTGLQSQIAELQQQFASMPTYTPPDLSSYATMADLQQMLSGMQPQGANQVLYQGVDPFVGQPVFNFQAGGITNRGLSKDELEANKRFLSFMKNLKNPFSGFIDRQVMQTKQNRMLREDKTLSDLNKELKDLKGIYLPTEEDKMKVAQLTQDIRNRENELLNEISTEPIRGIIEDVPVSDTRSDVVFGNKGLPQTTAPKTTEAPKEKAEIEEVEVTAEKKKVKPKPEAKPKPKKKIDISSRLGRNQLATLKKRRQRIKDNPDAFKPDYAIEFLPDYLKNEYRSELLQLAETFDAGGKTDFPDLNKDGKVTYADVLKGRGVEEKQTGGQTMISEDIIQEVMADPLTAQLTQFLLGEIDDNTVVTNFVNKYGPEVFQVIRTQVLQSIVPNAQTEGMIEGVGNGGMDDDIDGMIGNRQPVAVSQDEYIVPADVMSMLGDGSSDAGAKKLDMMLDRVRMDKTGTTKQARPIKDEEVLPA